MKAMKIHPLCAVFSSVAPLAKGEHSELMEDIKLNGIKLPILVDRKKGTILDGLTRWKIAHDLKLKPAQIPLEVFKGKDEDIPGEILSRNVHRRHLTDDQRAALVSKIRGPQLEKEARERQSAAGTFKSNGKGKGKPIEGKGSVAEKIAKEAGTTLHKATQAEKARKSGLLDDVIAGKDKLRKAAKKAGKSNRKPAKRKEVPFEDQVYKKWIAFINRFSPVDKKKVLAMIKVWIGK